MDNSRYPTHVFWSDEDEGFIALCSDLPGCSAFGETQEEALAELQDAIASWKTAKAAAGGSIPAPSVPPAALQHSGKLLVRMPKTLHQRLAGLAEAESVSLNLYVVSLLSSTLEPQKLRSANASIDTQQFYLATSIFQQKIERGDTFRPIVACQESQMKLRSTDGPYATVGGSKRRQVQHG